MTADSSILFVHDSQIDEEVRNHLGSTVEIQPYESFFSYLKELSSGLGKESKPVSLWCFLWCICLTVVTQKRILISKQASLAIEDAVGKVGPLSVSCRSLSLNQKSQDFSEIDQSIVANLKSIKNDVEISGFRECHVRDGAALIRYFAWLEEQLEKGVALSESDGADQLEKYRSWVPESPLRLHHPYFPPVNLNTLRDCLSTQFLLLDPMLRLFITSPAQQTPTLSRKTKSTCVTPGDNSLMVPPT